jgi:hypothetical protein
MYGHRDISPDIGIFFKNPDENSESLTRPGQHIQPSDPTQQITVTTVTGNHTVVHLKEYKCSQPPVTVTRTVANFKLPAWAMIFSGGSEAHWQAGLAGTGRLRVVTVTVTPSPASRTRTVTTRRRPGTGPGGDPEAIR